MAGYHSYIDPNTTIHKPFVPYFGTITGGVGVGTLIIVYGKVPNFAKRFDLNFLIGSIVNETTKNSGDIAFHWNPRFDERVVVRNSRKSGVWGKEEREPYTLPLERSHDFQVMILVEENGYKVAVNGKHFIDYYHRMPISTVGIFNIAGDVTVDRIEYRREYRYKREAEPDRQPLVYNTSLMPVYNPLLPYAHSFASGLRDGMMIYLSGRLDSNPNAFSIDFCANHDIAFHFNVRYRNSVVVRNTCRNTVWESEERDMPYWPFAAGVHFDMMVRVETKRFLIAINGQHFVQYLHRIPFNLVNKLQISGDVLIASIRFV